MRGCMKRYVWVSSSEKIAVPQCDGIWIGSEVCDEFLSSPDLLKRMDFYASAGYQAGIIMPYLTPEREELFISLLNRLSQPTEIVVNDVGALFLTQESIHIPVIGRLMMRQMSDPAILSFYHNQSERLINDGSGVSKLVHVDPPPPLTRHLVDSPLFSEEAAAILLSVRTEVTVMMDWLPHGMPVRIPDHIRVMLNTEDILVSVLPCTDCRTCPAAETLVGKTRGLYNIYRKKNICYYKRCEISVSDNEALPSYVSNVIISNPDAMTE